MLEPILTFEDTGEFPLSLPAAVSRLGEGYALVSSIDQSAVGLFDGAGRYLRRAGRPGSGPGEFRSILSLISSGDTLHAFDVGNRRHTMFNEALEVVDERPMTVPPSERSVVLVEDGYVLLGTETIGDSTYAIQYVSSELDHRRSFDTDIAASPGRFVTSGPDRTLWSHPVGSSVVERWSLDSGELVYSAELELDWLSTGDGDERSGRVADQPERTEAPPADIIALQWDGRGILWMLGRVPDPDWQRADRGEYARIFDSVVIMFRPSDGKVLEQRRLDEFAFMFADRAIVATYWQNDRGEPLVRLLRVGATEE